MTTSALPRFVVLNVPKAATNTYVCRKDDGLVIDGGDSTFSPLVKIEIERATKNADGNSIVAISNKPEENTMKPSCTLFESSLQSDELHLTHVKTGWRVMINNFTKAFYVNKNSIGAPLRFVDWDRLVKLPQHVAFKGYNGEYLKAYHHEDLNYLQFGSDDPISTLSGHKVSLMRDDHVRM
ncbi:uncharacterized protein LOC125189777 [Salvia hispanica]|uniref:uncharacterized protein LOC125189777 n=1 Tax=Salvia hispanica TaxID=49212 RepID=UPI002009198F|nr:uncharacterized protein LOC125189777 [Salvia hispanica]